jgi:type 2 lantibiotic biosynthesis protein LanM
LITTENKIEQLNMGSYLKERLLSYDADVTISSEIMAEVEQWRAKTGLDQSAFEEKWEAQGISYDHFLMLLKNNPAPFTNVLPWQQTFEEIVSIYSKHLKEKPRENTGIFVRPFIIFFEISLRKQFKHIDNSKVNLESFIHSCEVNLSMELKEISDKVVILEFHKLKDELQLDSVLKFEQFTEEYLQNPAYIIQILHAYPVMARILTELTLRFIRNTTTLLNRYFNDYEEITTVILGKKIKLQSVSYGHGDSHKDGQTVAILLFNQEEKLVYKPRALRTDKAFNSFIKWINEEGLTVPLVGIKCITRSDYGWQAFVKKEECQTVDDIKRYYFRMGAFIAIFHLLRTNDMHYENLIASGDKPYLIDLETVFSNSIYSGDVLPYPRRDLLNTVLSNGVLPADQLFASAIDFDPSAIGGRNNQESKKMNGWVLIVDDNGDPRYEKRNFVTFEVNHLVTYQGEVIKPVDYLSYIEQGFLETYTIFLKKKEQLLSKILTAFNGTECRIVLRPTYLYARFLQASHHPTYLLNGTAREKLFEMFWNAAKFEEKFKEIVPSEIECLLNNDVPYFTFEFNSKHLYDSRRKKIENAFKVTSLERVVKQIERLSLADCYEQLKLIKLTINANDVSGFEMSEIESMSASNSGEEETMSHSFLDVAKDIGDYFVKQAIISEDEQFASWLGLENIENRALLWPLEFALYNGMLGISLFLSHLYKYTDNDEYKEIVYKNISYIKHTLNQTEGDISNSMFNGIGSVMYSLYRMSQLFKDEQLAKDALSFLPSLGNLQKVESKDGLGRVHENDRTDYLDGYAGIIVFLVHLYEESKPPDVLESIKKYSDIFISSLMEQPYQSILGFAHGSSGLLLALTKLSNVIENDNIQDLIEQLINYEDQLYNPSIMNWPDLRNEEESPKYLDYWCHGAPGILLGRSFIKKSTEQENAVIERLMSEYTNNEKLGLCHGVFGTLDILLCLARKYPEHISESMVRKYGRSILTEEITKSKIKGMKDRGLNGLMVGISGIGYTLLRMLDPVNVPSVLLFELPMNQVSK